MTMQLKAEIWIKAYLRTASAHGAFATIVRHGDDDAGVIFIKVNRLDGTVDLYVPAPTGLADMDRGTDRLWVLAMGPAAGEADVEARIASEIRFDSDVWVVEIEDRQGRHFLDDWLLVSRT